MLLDDASPDHTGRESPDERRFDRLTAVLGPLNWRVGLVVGTALLAGAGATVATADLGGLDDRQQPSTRIETEALAQTASTVESSESASPEPSRNETGPAPLAVPAGDDDGTSTTDGTTSTADEPTTSSDSSTTTTDASTTSDGSGGPASGVDDSTSTTGDRTTTTTDRTTTTGRTTSTTGDQTTTTQATTTQATTTTTEATTTTTEATTTTTEATTTTTQAGDSCATGAEFELTMRDDFNGSSLGGQWLRWDNDTGNAGNGRRMASQLSVANGQMTIRAEMVDGVLYSGGFNHTVAQTYGKYRFRVRTDVDPSRVMSGVILTWPASNAHPRDGENNIYETLPHQDSATRDPFYSFIHKPFGGTGDQEYKIHRADAAQWQTMTMEWTPNRITIVRDGGDTWTIDETGADLIPDVAHRFHIQLDATQQSISGPVTMQVDFAEVYRYCG